MAGSVVSLVHLVHVRAQVLVRGPPTAFVGLEVLYRPLSLSRGTRVFAHLCAGGMLSDTTHTPLREFSVLGAYIYHAWFFCNYIL